MQTKPTISTALATASALKAPATGPQIMRLAGAIDDAPEPDGTREVLREIASAIEGDICELDAAARLEKLPGVEWVRAFVYCGYNPNSKYSKKALSYTAGVRVDGKGIEGKSDTSLLSCVEQIEGKFAEEAKKAAREKTIRERVEREMAELEAAEKSLTAHATAPQHPEELAESVAAKFKAITGQNLIDSRENPDLEPFDGVTPADGEVGR